MALNNPCVSVRTRFGTRKAAGGATDEYRHRALDQHLRERAHVLWQQGGSVEGGAGEDWDQTREFQAR